jgi:hypothetical protein
MYVAGYTQSTDFPVTSNAYDNTYNGGSFDAFVSKLNSSLTTLLASTFLGGSEDDYALSIAIDTFGNVYVAGETYSADFPATFSAYDNTYNGGTFDAFVSKLDSNLSKETDYQQISISPSSYDFGTVAAGSSSSPQIFTISDTGTADLIISSMSITGTDSDQFTLQTVTCTSLTPTISSGGSCTVSVTFTPTSEGSKSASWQIISNDSDSSPLNVSLSGTGSQAADLPDLTGQWLTMTQTCKTKSSGTKCKIKGQLSIQNIGTQDATTSFVRYYLSTDSTYNAGDTFLKQVATGKVKVGRSKTKTLSYSFPTGQSASGQYVIAVIDADNTIVESNDNNNNIAYGPVP